MVTNQTLTEILTDKCLIPQPGDIPESSYQAAKKLLLDTLGCALAGRKAPGIDDIIKQMSDWGGKAESTILLCGSRVPCPHAAFANSAMIHAQDYDDVYIPGLLHITSVVVPPALALAEREKISSKEMLAAMIMGIETAARIARAETPLRRGMGFLPSSTAGGFGAVMAAARLMKLSPGQCVNAMGINYAQCSGNRQALLDQTLTKRIQPGFSVRSALWAASLAANKITGPKNALEGNAGYFKVYMNGTVPEPDVFRNDRKQLAVERVSIKRYPSCGGCHHAQDAALKLREEENLKPEEIEKVEIFNCGPGGLVGNPFHLGENPQVNVQFSVAWAVAHALLRGKALLKDYTNECIRADREVVKLAKAIGYAAAPEKIKRMENIPEGYGQNHGKAQGVIVYTRDGRTLVRGQYPADTFPPGTQTFEDVIPKFMDCAAFSGLRTPDQAAEMVETIRSLDQAQSIRPLLNLFQNKS